MVINFANFFKIIGPCELIIANCIFVLSRTKFDFKIVGSTLSKIFLTLLFNVYNDYLVNSTISLSFYTNPLISLGFSNLALFKEVVND